MTGQAPRLRDRSLCSLRSLLLSPFAALVGASVLFAAALLVATGCGSSDEPGDNSADGGDSADAAPGADAVLNDVTVPTTADEMFTFLTAGDYLALEAESAVHASAGPHGSGGVRTYINALLAASLGAGGSEHPVGAAAIKELYGNDGVTVTGWAVSVKTDPGTGGASWYWYEVFSTTDGSNPIEGNNNNICTGCHSSGADFVRVPYPLQ